MTAALATNSANIIRAEAARLRGIGYIAQADQLDFVARQIEAVQMAAEAARQPPPPIAEPAVVPASAPRPAPPVVVMPPPQVPQVAAVDPLRERVAILVSHLRTHPKGSEDKALIGSYQANEPSYSGNIDGKYGPKTALAVASHGVVPPTPYYWAGPTAAMVGRQKAEYRQALEQKSFEDPIRAEEWKQAARAVK
jgi:peptidoglycan hydrolase-like protein with peptidoglycan-binding domain